jgi:hypothetical protein
MAFLPPLPKTYVTSGAAGSSTTAGGDTRPRSQGYLDGAGRHDQNQYIGWRGWGNGRDRLWKSTLQTEKIMSPLRAAMPVQIGTLGNGSAIHCPLPHGEQRKRAR